jgi:nucleoside-triphosphatase
LIHNSGMRKNILITGMPRSGKSTLLNEVIGDYPEKVGFVTKEIRKDDTRTGFEIETNNGIRSALASVDFNTGLKVSKYGVNINNLDSVIPEVSRFSPNDLLYLDEIGQMELFSDNFKDLTLRFLDSGNVCVATVSMVYKDKFIEELKKRKDVILVEIDETNKEDKKDFLRALIKKIYKAKRYINEPERFERQGDKIILKSEHSVREININENGLNCNCGFYKENSICSHVIAAEELLSTKSI